MQYILTKQEMQDLKDKQDPSMPSKEALQKFCTDIANTFPIKYWGREEATPWKCYLTLDDEWYCDECPCQKVCPADKEWSK